VTVQGVATAVIELVIFKVLVHAEIFEMLVIRVVPVTVAPGARQLHALESLDGFSEQYVANAGRLVVAV
jgi:hypothetical protein